MALQSSGQISLNDIHLEVGGSTTTQVSLNDSDVRALIGKASGAQNSFDEYYGASSNVELSIPDSGTNINGQSQLQEITVSDYISSGGQLTIPSSLWIWSDSTSTAALTIDIPCTIVNNGKIIGKGGAGGGTTNVSITSPTAAQNAGEAGGHAIKINSSVSGVTITNNSGAYIAGGGGGGGGASVGPLHGDSDYYTKAGGGGGAGGGAGQSSYRKNNDLFFSGGAGGVLNAAGGNGGASGASGGVGGDGGGGGGISVSANASFGRAGGAGGGGRNIVGSLGADGLVDPNGGDGAADASSTLRGGGGAGFNINPANSVGNGGTGVNGGFGGVHGGGGGGWGGAGGSGGGASGVFGAGGAAGKAIEDSGNSYTLTNNGTIYGATT